MSTSVRDRIAALNGRTVADRPAASALRHESQRPQGTVLHSGVLSKAGVGILASRFAKRHCVIHVLEGSAWLSTYEDQALMILKGKRIPLDAAAISHADDKLQVVTHTGGMQVAKFQAADSADAQAWANRLRRAAGEMVPAASPPRYSGGDDSVSAPEKLRRGSSMFPSRSAEPQQGNEVGVVAQASNEQRKRPGLSGRHASLEATFDAADRTKERPPSSRRQRHQLPLPEADSPKPAASVAGEVEAGEAQPASGAASAPLPKGWSAAVMAAPIPPMEKGWRQATAPDGRIYFYHVHTRETRDEYPAAAMEETVMRVRAVMRLQAVLRGRIERRRLGAGSAVAASAVVVVPVL